jgi:hypothetical protein
MEHIADIIQHQMEATMQDYNTGDAVTRLETPILDITSLTNPYLIFKHIQQDWGR